MNLQYFYNFVIIVEEGSLTAAARKLNIAQPALSNQIKAMEKKYGARLFFRGARRLELTDAGRVLYERAKDICQIDQQAKNQIASGFSGEKGMLRLGASPAVNKKEIQRALLGFVREYPQTEVRLLLARSAELYKMLQNGIVEVAFAYGLQELPENVELVYSVENPMMAVYRPGAGLLDKIKKETVSVRDLSGIPLAMEEYYQAEAASAFRARDAQMYVKFLSSLPDMALVMAGEGLAVALVPQGAVPNLPEGLKTKRLSDSSLHNPRLSLLCQKGNYRSRVVNNFLQMVNDQADWTRQGKRLPGDKPADK